MVSRREGPQRLDVRKADLVEGASPAGQTCRARRGATGRNECSQDTPDERAVLAAGALAPQSL